MFWGSLFAIIAGIIVNFIILELFYNFIISKKSKKQEANSFNELNQAHEKNVELESEIIELKDVIVV